MARKWYLYPVEDRVLRLRRKCQLFWLNKSNLYWWWRFLLEFLELTFALIGWHKHEPDLELEQLAAIAINWLDKRKDDHERKSKHNSN